MRPGPYFCPMCSDMVATKRDIVMHILWKHGQEINDSGSIAVDDHKSHNEVVSTKHPSQSLLPSPTIQDQQSSGSLDLPFPTKDAILSAAMRPMHPGFTSNDTSHSATNDVSSASTSSNSDDNYSELPKHSRHRLQGKARKSCISSTHTSSCFTARKSISSEAKISESNPLDTRCSIKINKSRIFHSATMSKSSISSTLCSMRHLPAHIKNNTKSAKKRKKITDVETVCDNNGIAELIREFNKFVKRKKKMTFRLPKKWGTRVVSFLEQYFEPLPGTINYGLSFVLFLFLSRGQQMFHQMADQTLQYNWSTSRQSTEYELGSIQVSSRALLAYRDNYGLYHNYRVLMAALLWTVRFGIPALNIPPNIELYQECPIKQ